MGQCVECTGECPGEVKSDKCVKYTGPNIPLLNINTGDSLACVEASIFAFLAEIKNGTKLDIDLSDVTLCKIITDNLAECVSCTGISLTDIIKALIKSVCDIQVSIDSINGQIATLEAIYDKGCLTGVTGSEGTHAMLQAVITKLCSVNSALTALTLNVSTNYISVSEIDGYIESYITTSPTYDKMYSKMIPFSTLPYFGPRNNFDTSGAGIGVWEKIYLCNGANNTPDLRGNTLVGANTMGTNSYLNNNTNPGAPFNNPNYDLRTTNGTNKVTLNLTQIPTHGHTATINETPHTHGVGQGGQGLLGLKSTGSTTRQFENQNTANTPLESTFSTLPTTTGLTVSNSTEGGGQAHDNVQPSVGCFYIIYIP